MAIGVLAVLAGSEAASGDGMDSAWSGVPDGGCEAVVDDAPHEDGTAVQKECGWCLRGGSVMSAAMGLGIVKGVRPWGRCIVMQLLVVMPVADATGDLSALRLAVWNARHVVPGAGRAKEKVDWVVHRMKAWGIAMVAMLLLDRIHVSGCALEDLTG